MILITEFMDVVAVNLLKKKYDVYYDISLVEDPNSLIKKILKMKALIVRNKTLVTRELIENAYNEKLPTITGTISGTYSTSDSTTSTDVE